MRRLLAFIASCIASVVGLLGCNESSSTPTAAPSAIPPGPVQSRAGLLYGYYGSMPGQVAETSDHVNLQWVSPWGASGDGLLEVKTRLKEAREARIECVVLDIPMAYVGEADVRSYFDALHAEGLIDSRICALYPVDEPDLVGHSAEEVRVTNAMLRRVAKDYPFIANVPLAVIYTAKGEWPGIETYDWVGFDDYDRGAGVLSNSTWVSLKAHLRPEQRVLLVPGGAFGQDPQPFYDKAQADPQVVAVIAFIWFDHWDGDKQGIRSLPVRGQYVGVGQRIKNPT